MGMGGTNSMAATADAAIKTSKKKLRADNGEEASGPKNEAFNKIEDRVELSGKADSSDGVKKHTYDPAMTHKKLRDALQNNSVGFSPKERSVLENIVK